MRTMDIQFLGNTVSPRSATELILCKISVAGMGDIEICKNIVNNTTTPYFYEIRTHKGKIINGRGVVLLADCITEACFNMFSAYEN